MTQRIGFCCKFVALGKKDVESVLELNTRSTTVAWLKRQPRKDAEQRLWDIMEHNLAATRALVVTVGNLPPQLRMVRLSSDLLPVYTEPTFSYYWQQPYVKAYCEKAFAEIGQVARSMDVRLSFHPGQFCVLASDNPDIVTRSIEEFEYHVDMARYMGYGKEWHDHGFKINVHISGRLGPGGIIAALSRLSPEARNLITIENEENKHGLDTCLELVDHVAIVMDLHHHWCNTGDYISRVDPRVDRVIESWRGVRPVLHYSVSREDVLQTHQLDERPCFSSLLENGHKKQKLRAHSDFMWNHAVNQYAGKFWDAFDIQVEAKAKNLASFALYRELVNATTN
jgi:UV DNA damage repair endonuclease